MSLGNSNLIPTRNPKPADAYQPLLTESVDRFLTEYRKGVSDFSNFTSIFSRLLHNLPDPSLEIVWFYSAVTFHATKFTVQDTQKRVSATKDIFQLLVSCSYSCNVVSKTAVLAPVVNELCRLVLDRKDSKREVESLLEGVTSYISICCGANAEIEDDRLSSRFVDLLRVWMVDRIGENGEIGVDLKVFFPLVSEEVRKRIGVGCGVGYLAGVVMCEAFLLRLSLKFGSGLSRIELEKDLHDCAVQMITGFRNFYFLDTLLKMLLEPVLPVTSLLAPENELLLREILYDVVITVDYSFLNPQGGILLTGKQLKNLALTWLFIVDKGLQSARENGNQNKVFLHISAFSKSFLPSQLIKWVTNQMGMGDKASNPIVSSPIALIKWLLIVEDQGLGIFECDITKIYAKAAICKSRVAYEFPVVKSNSKNLGGGLFFYTDQVGREERTVDGDLEMVDSMDAVTFVAPGLMKSTITDGVRKRKEGNKVEGEIPFKYIKYQFHESSVREKSSRLVNDDGLSGGSELDEDMEK